MRSFNSWLSSALARASQFTGILPSERKSEPKARKQSKIPMAILWPSWDRGTYVREKHGELRRVPAPMVPREALRQGKLRAV